MAKHEALSEGLRDAVLHIFDLGYLEGHPLAAALPDQAGVAAGPHLRKILVESIEAMRPPGLQTDPRRSRHRGYALMRQRYVEGGSVAQVCDRLSISRSQYYREHDQALAALAAIVATRLHPPAEDRPPRSPPHQTFIGREAELRTLNELFVSAAAGRGGHLVMTRGATGTGKTALAEEAGRRAAAVGGDFFAGRYLRDANATYRPWVEALGAMLATLPRAAAQGVVGPYRSQLAQLFPVLGETAPGPLDDLLGPGDRRAQLHDGLAHMLRRVAERRPLLLLIDDLQWAPELGILRLMASRLAHMRVVIVATLRLREFEQREDLVRQRAEIARMGSVAELELPPLTPGETERLVAARLGAERGLRLSAAVHRRTGGNPLFIEETVRALKEEVTDPAALPLPDSLRAAVRERVRRLGPLAERVLAQAAVLGEAFRFGDLRGVSGSEDDELIEVLGTAVTAGLLEDLWRAGVETYTFREPHVREALYESVTPPLRRRWHLRAGQLLADSGAPEDEIAHHLIQGGDAATGAAYALRAARAAEAACDFVAAVTRYRLALRLWEDVGGHLPDRAEAWLRLGDAIHFADGEAGPAIDALTHALDLYQELGDQRGVAMLHVRLGRERSASVDVRVRDVPAAMAHLRAAQAILSAHPDELAIERDVWQVLAFAHSFAMNGQQALAAAVRAAEVARAVGETGPILLADGLRGALTASCGRVGEGLAVADQALRAARMAGLQREAGMILFHRCGVNSHLHPAAVAALTAPKPGPTSRPWWSPMPLLALDACAHTGDLARGQALWDAVSQVLADAELPFFGPDPQFAGRLLLRRGEWEAAERLLAAAIEWAEAAGDLSNLASGGWVMGALRLARGEPDGAEPLLARSAAIQRESGFALGWAHCLAVYVRCLTELGRLEAAEEALAQLGEVLAPGEDWGRLAAGAALAEGVLRARQGRGPEAEAAFSRAVDVYHAEGLRWDEAFAMDQWGRSLADRTDLRAEARQRWVVMGADRYAERVAVT